MNATANVIVTKATATAEAQLQPYILYTSGKLVLNDPLINNSKGNGWDEDISVNPPFSCTFSTNGYQSYIGYGNFNFQPCIANNTDFGNFAFQVTMTIIKGDTGGILIRADSTNTAYYLYGIGSDGSYFLSTYDAKQSVTTKALLAGISTSIHKGVGQSNLITIVADNDNLFLYVNKQYVNNIHDKSFSSGKIGAFAEDDMLPTTVVFTNAQVWKI